MLTMSLQVSVDVHDSAASFEHSTHISSGCISINYSVSYGLQEGHLELWGHSQHDIGLGSSPARQTGVPGEANLQGELQMHDELRSRAQHPLGPHLVLP